MSGGEVLKELLYLEAGYVDEKSSSGVKMGLRSKLEARRLALEMHITESVDSKRAVAA